MSSTTQTMSMSSSVRKSSVSNVVSSSVRKPSVSNVVPSSSSHKPNSNVVIKKEDHDIIKKKRVISTISPSFVEAMMIATNGQLSKNDTKSFCEKFVKVLVTKVKNGENVGFRNNIIFSRALRKARTYKNPKTKESVDKEAHYIMTMRVKPTLKRAFEEIEIVK